MIWPDVLITNDPNMETFSHGINQIISLRVSLSCMIDIDLTQQVMSLYIVYVLMLLQI